MTQSDVAVPRLSSTILFLRDDAAGLTVFMVRRSRQVEFAVNALVFPGGTVRAGDRNDCLPLAGAGGLDDEARALRVAGLREAFEEAGMLRALTDGGPISDDRCAALDPFRAGLDRGERDFADLLLSEGLALDIGGIVRFAHWITPKVWPKRFDTHFFLCPAPPGLHPRVDGREVVEGLWSSPQEILRQGEAGTHAIMFPTRMVLTRLARFGTSAQALAEAPLLPMVPCEPVLTTRDGIDGLIIPSDAGYDEVWEPLNSMVRGITGGVTHVKGR